MAAAFGLSAVMVHKPSGGPISGFSFATAAALGIPAIIAEDGGAGEYSPEIAARMLAGCENVPCGLGVLLGPVRDMPAARRFDSFVWPRSRHAGFFKPDVRVGNQVEVGTILGTISNLFGEIIETVMGEIDGRYCSWW